jgi:hypothetical protein
MLARSNFASRTAPALTPPIPVLRPPVGLRPVSVRPLQIARRQQRCRWSTMPPSPKTCRQGGEARYDGSACRQHCTEDNSRPSSSLARTPRLRKSTEIGSIAVATSLNIPRQSLPAAVQGPHCRPSQFLLGRVSSSASGRRHTSLTKASKSD